MSFTTVASGDHFAVLIFLVLSQDRLLELPPRSIDLLACPNDLESHNKTVNAPACRALCHLKYSSQGLERDNALAFGLCIITLSTTPLVL